MSTDFDLYCLDASDGSDSRLISSCLFSMLMAIGDNDKDLSAGLDPVDTNSRLKFLYWRGSCVRNCDVGIRWIIQRKSLIVVTDQP